MAETQKTSGLEDSKFSSTKEVDQWSIDEDNIDLKSRVKAMFLIDDQNVTEKSPLEGRHVKVTTFFSRNSKEARTSFSSTSISDLDDSITGTEGESTKQTSVNIVRTLNTSDAPSSAGAKKKPRKLRTRDSLLKLHEQTNVSSSIGSDTDSELISALRNQGDYDVRERDLALGLLTGDAIYEDDHPVSHTDILNSNPILEHKTYINTIESGELSYNGSESKSEILQYNDALNLDRVARGFSPPKVIIQQPSEDNSHEHLRRLNLPLLNFSSTISPEQGIASPPIDPTDNKQTFLSKHGSSSTWLRRSPRMQLLSPNAALTKKQYYDDLQPKCYTTSATDDSHPELDYLDIIPKLSQYQRNEQGGSHPDHLQSTVKRDSLPKLLLYEPEKLGMDYGAKSARMSMRSPEPKQLIDFGEDDDAKMDIKHDSKIGLPIFTLGEDEFDYQCQRWSETTNDSEIVDTVGFYLFDINELTEARSAIGNNVPNYIDTVMSFTIGNEESQGTLFNPNIPFENDNSDALYFNANEGFRGIYENSTCDALIDYTQNNGDAELLPLHLEITAADTADGNTIGDGALDFIGSYASSVRTSDDHRECVLGVDLYQEPKLMLESSPDGECYTEALTPWSNVIDNVTLPGDILDPQSQQYKKLLSVTSHDSGFDSQGSPIELTTLKTADWTSTSFRVVQEEAQNEESEYF